MIPIWLAVRILRTAYLIGLGLVATNVGLFSNARWAYWLGMAILGAAILNAWLAYRVAVGMQRGLSVDPKRLRRAGAAAEEQMAGRRGRLRLPRKRSAASPPSSP